MTTTTEAMRLALEALEELHYSSATHVADDAYYAATSALRAALAAEAPQPEPVHGDVLPPLGSRVWIRHGRDDDAHACTVVGYYAWPDLGGNRHLHRVFVHLVYEGTTRPQARMLCDVWPTEAEARTGAAPAGVVGEPVAWMYDFVADDHVVKGWLTTDYDEAHSPTMQCHNIVPLYTAPPARQALSQEHVISALALVPSDLSHPARCRWIADRLNGISAPPARQALAQSEVDTIVREATRGSAIRRDGSTSHRIARAIERACAEAWGVTLVGIGGNPDRRG